MRMTVNLTTTLTPTALNKLKDEITKELQDEIEEVTKDIAKNMSETSRVKTGRLKNSFHALTSSTPKTYRYKDDEGRSFQNTIPYKASRTPNKVSTYAGSGTEYVGKIEAMDGNMFNAFEQGKTTITKRLQAALDRAVD